MSHPATSRSRYTQAIAAALFLFSSPFASATLIASDEFNYNLGALSGANGGYGWAGAWTASSGASIVDPAIDLSGNRALAVSANSDNLAWRTLANSYSGDVYVSMLMQVGSGAVSSNDFVSLWFDIVTSGAHTTRPQIGIKADISGSNDIFARTTGSGGAVAPDSNVVAGQTFLVVGKLSKVSSTNYNQFDLWFNPSAGDFSSPDASFSGNSGLSALSTLGLRSVNLDSGDTVLIDNLRLGTAWSDVSPVPEPSSLALSALGMCVLMCYRRRRQV
ncbi:PEP-CTERM sorting domain-containing protein [Uliginosibacterium sp. H3]|uniref:PEP-CTERM sorting domain-containing protein n=1 Tax=Uliginosibacterium silvisoli TaxID=3114758 RepID=A0ABU6K7I6_9RHOO|nr:PEP-CTERM sorting domain-containing protein [Uliginosibacterium sp. H3]